MKKNYYKLFTLTFLLGAVFFFGSQAIYADTLPDIIIDAGPDRFITLPTNSVFINATENGLSDTIQWTKVSGPASYTIDDPNAVDITISGLVVGTYVFRLDGTSPIATAGSDSVQIVVNPVPLLPDLTVTTGSVIPTTATAGTPVSFSFTVSNIGNATTAINFFDKFQKVAIVAKDIFSIYLLYPMNYFYLN